MIRKDVEDEERRFVEEISCDFKNLLMIISSNAELMENRTEDVVLLHCLDNIEEASGRAATLVRRLETLNDFQ